MVFAKRSLVCNMCTIARLSGNIMKGAVCNILHFMSYSHSLYVGIYGAEYIATFSIMHCIHVSPLILYHTLMDISGGHMLDKIE